MPRPSQNLIGLGWQIASTLVIFTLGGYGLDQWLDTTPWLTLTGALLGLVGVFALIFRMAAELDREAKSPSKRAGETENRETEN
jgi:F0F1-type ATP synthase assembly protein I